MTAKRPITLPERRVSIGERVPLDNGLTLFLHCGFDLDGTVREIFVNCRKATSEFAYMLAEQARELSFRLQYGPRLSDLEPRSDTWQVLIARALVIEREGAADAIAQYQAAGLVQ